MGRGGWMGEAVLMDGRHYDGALVVKGSLM